MKFKAQKNIKINSEIEYILTRLYHLDYAEERIYWNKRVLEEKICDVKKRYHFHMNLIHLYVDAKEYELGLEYAKKAIIWYEECDFKVLQWHDITMFDRLGHAASRLKRYAEASKYYKEGLKYGK